MSAQKETNTEARARRREEYEQVLRIVECNTGGKQPALIARTSLLQLATQAGLSIDRARKRIQAAVGNEDLLEWNGKLARADRESLQAVVAEENAAEYPRVGLLKRCDQLAPEVDNE